MSSKPDHRPVFRFRIADLLLVVASLAVLLSLCISLNRLYESGDAQEGLGSRLRMVDGQPEAVGAYVLIFEDGTVLFTRKQSYVASLKKSFSAQILVLFALVFWLHRRFHQRGKPQVSLRSLGMIMASVVAFCLDAGLTPLDLDVASGVSEFMFYLSLLLLLAAGASLGYDALPTWAGIALGLLVGLVMATLALPCGSRHWIDDECVTRWRGAGGGGQF
jgi:hypothetical protein